MAVSVGDIREYKGFKFVVVQIGDGFAARIRKSNGKHLTVEGQTKAAFQTVAHADAVEAAEEVVTLVDNGLIS